MKYILKEENLLNSRKVGIFISSLIIAGFFAAMSFPVNESFFVRAQSSEISPPKMLSRKDWNARDALREKMTAHKISYITIHHTAYPQKPQLALEKKMQNLQSFSQTANKLDSGKEKPAWGDIPYHYYVAADGQIAEGREIDFAGDSNTNYDPAGHALIVLEGNFQNETPAAEQVESLEKLVFWLARKYKVSPSAVKGHNDYAATGCPGVNLKNLLEPLRVKLAAGQK